MDTAQKQDKKGYRTNSHWNEFYKWLPTPKLYSGIDAVKREADNRNISQGQKSAFDQMTKQVLSRQAPTYDPEKVDRDERRHYDSYQERLKQRNRPKKDPLNLPHMANMDTSYKAASQDAMGFSKENLMGSRDNDRLNDAFSQKDVFGQTGSTPGNKAPGKTRDTSVEGRHDLDARFSKDPCASIDKYDIVNMQACRNKNPVTGPDMESLVDAVAGYGDAVSLGATKLAREKAGIDGGVDENSTAYAVGETASALVPGAGVGARGAAALTKVSKTADKVLNKGKFRVGYEKRKEMPDKSPFAAVDRPRVAWGHPKKGVDGKIDKKHEDARHIELRMRPFESVKQQMGQILKEQKGKKPSDVLGHLNNYRKQLVKRKDEKGVELIEDWINQYLYQNKNKEWFWRGKPYWE